MAFLSNFWYIFIALFCLGFSIFIHELGHFIAAKKRGLVADRFSIGFGPRICGWRWKGTDFRISLLPLGGYVSLPQLADMGRLEGGKEEEASKLPPISYADKMIVAVMGAVFNIILAFALSLIVWGMGRDVVNTTEVGYVAKQLVNSEGELVPGPAHIAGIQEGDRILAVDNTEVSDWDDYMQLIRLGLGHDEAGNPRTTLTIQRGETTKELTVFPAIATSENMRFLGLLPPTVEGKNGPVVLMLEKDMPAYEAGLEVDDQLIALNDEPIVSSEFLRTFLAKNGNKIVNVTVLRSDRELVIPIKPRIKKNEERPRFGFQYDYPYLTERVHENPIIQLAGMADTMRRTLVALLNRNSDVKLRNMQAPVGIVHTLSTVARNGFVLLCWIVALINVNLAIFNLLPIPVLDGGHMMFATISKLSGQKLPRALMENLQFAFVVLLLGLMAYITFFDVSRWGRDLGLIKEPEVNLPASKSVEPASTENTTPKAEAE